MTSPRRRRLPHAAIVGLILGAEVAAGALLTTPAPAATSTRPPLDVTLTQVSPRVPRSGTVVLRGTVRNTSKETWSDLEVYGTVARTPLVDAAGLAAAAATATDIEAGLDRLGEHGSLGDLAPGQSRRFRLRLDRAALQLPSTPGVYLLGVQVLGTDDVGRDFEADGRARTFVPQLSGRGRPVPVTVTVPIRARVRHYATGALRDPAGVQEAVSPGGRLEALLGLAEAAGGRRVELVVDPAVVDAAAEAGGRPARAWVRRFLTQARGRGVLGTGYADPDIAALTRLSPRLLVQSRIAGVERWAARDITVRPVAAPDSGQLPDATLAALPDHTQVLVRGPAEAGGPWRTGAAQVINYTDPGSYTGGPDPARPLSALSVRQRILAEAAVRRLAGDRTPMVVTLPATWDPGPVSAATAESFWAGLDQPWLTLAGLPDGVDARRWRSRLPYDDAERARELGEPAVTAARRVIRTGRRASLALVDGAEARAAWTRTGLETVSFHARSDRRRARIQAEQVRREINADLRRIRVVSSPLVAMSGGSGTIVVTLVNDLDRPVRVGITSPTKGTGIRIADFEPVELQPGARTTARLQATADRVGVRSLQLRAVTPTGQPVGTPANLTVRSSNVGVLIWGLMGLAGAVLVGMIARRWIKRGLRTRAEPM